MYKLGMILVVIGSIGIVSALTLIVADKNKNLQNENYELNLEKFIVFLLLRKLYII